MCFLTFALRCYNKKPHTCKRRISGKNCARPPAGACASGKRERIVESVIFVGVEKTKMECHSLLNGKPSYTKLVIKMLAQVPIRLRIKRQLGLQNAKLSQNQLLHSHVLVANLDHSSNAQEAIQGVYPNRNPAAITT